MIQPALKPLPTCLISFIESNDCGQNSHLTDLQNLYLSASDQHFSSINLETQLEEFIQWSLQQSYLKHYPQDTLLQILDCAWEVQKLLWKIR